MIDPEKIEQAASVYIVDMFRAPTQNQEDWSGEAFLAGARFAIAELRPDLDAIKKLHEASIKLGAWMSAALSDPCVCVEMKKDIHVWFEALAKIKGEAT